MATDQLLISGKAGIKLLVYFSSELVGIFTLLIWYCICQSLVQSDWSVPVQ